MSCDWKRKRVPVKRSVEVKDEVSGQNGLAHAAKEQAGHVKGDAPHFTDVQKAEGHSEHPVRIEST